LTISLKLAFPNQQSPDQANKLVTYYVTQSDPKNECTGKLQKMIEEEGEGGLSV
jgi:hypothetical protein